MKSKSRAYVDGRVSSGHQRQVDTTGADLSGRYRSWKCWTPGSFGAFSREQAEYFALELRHAGVVSLKNRAVLEIGFGNGQFAMWAKAQGARYKGTEQISELVELARSAGLDAVDSATSWEGWLEPESLDLVVAFDVLEHLRVDAIQHLLIATAARMHPNALFVARVPSGDSPFGRATQHGDLTHQTSFGSSAVCQLAASVGLELVCVRAPVDAWKGVGPVRAAKRIGISLVRALVYPLIVNIFMGGGPAVLAPNMIFVLRRGAPTPILS